MDFPLSPKRAGVFGAVSLLFALYLANLTGMGLVTPDEPRYAAIGRAMAQSGDWITPRLWGQPWFEKPAFLYWMTATGFDLGLGPELAPRLPVALLSVAFLIFFWWRIRLGWDARVAAYSTAMLATSAGWLAYSHVSVTDIPLSVFFSAAVLLSLPWLENKGNAGLTPAAICLALATLAKGLVPLVLFLPVLAVGWRRLRDWFRPGPLLGFILCALPWYILCTARNGFEFARVFFLEHQLGRFSSGALQHVQPWWFYIPASLLLLYPWFPLLAFGLKGLQDRRLWTLACVVAFGFVFFSASVNKLPSYVLPLLPAVCLLMGFGLAKAKRPGPAMIAPLILIGALPAISRIIPTAIAHGLRAANIPWAGILAGFAGGAIVGLLVAFIFRKNAFPAAASVAGAGFLLFQFFTFPALDSAASARPIWLKNKPECAAGLNRSLQYGLNYYAGHEVPVCTVLDQNGNRVVR